MRIVIALLFFTLPLGAMNFSLKGGWDLTVTGGAVCGNVTAYTVERFSVQIDEAPLLNYPGSEFDLNQANVSGPFSLIVNSADGDRFELEGILLGTLVRQEGGGEGSPRTFLMLKAQLLSPSLYAQYRAPDSKFAGKALGAPYLELSLNGNMFSGHSLSGTITGGQCPEPKKPAINPYSSFLGGLTAGQLVGNTGRGGSLSERLVKGRDTTPTGSTTLSDLIKEHAAGNEKLAAAAPTSPSLSGLGLGPAVSGSGAAPLIEYSPLSSLSMGLLGGLPDPSKSAVVKIELKQR